jgi:hypothetical protein
VSDIAKHIGDLIAWFASEGPLRDTVLVIYSVCVALVLVAYRYYLGLLAQGAKPEGSIERKDYDALRASLAGGNLAARLYAKWLTAFLDWIERFFGDVGMADWTLFPHAFGLKTPAPLWTAPAFDRCLLLALVYPIAAIFVIWAISGHVGSAESALGRSPISQAGREVSLRRPLRFQSSHFGAAPERGGGPTPVLLSLSLSLPVSLSLSLSFSLLLSLLMALSLVRALSLLLSLSLSLSPSPSVSLSLSLSLVLAQSLSLSLALSFLLALSLALSLLLTLSLSMVLAVSLSLSFSL